MVFSSNVFLFLFLPLFLAVYFGSPQRWRNLVILLGSYLFYAWWRVDFLLLFVAVTAWNWWIGLRIDASRACAPHARRWLAAGVAGDLAVLGYFKYANFGIDTLDALLAAGGAAPLHWTAVILPIGISFYIFQAISYVVDVYRGDVEASRDPVAFAAFIALFPQLIAGPVLRYKDLAHQFEARRHTLALFAEGAIRFMQGFVKKVFIADSVAPIAAHGFALQDPSSADAWTAALAYTVQLYFDFSGYSDMAIGLGLMMGFRFMENFRQPYISQSITEFWRRWHISLSSWLRDYLYVPLGGNRGGTLRTYRNLLLTMLLGGLWHGANWTFVLWGAWHGLWLALERASGLGSAPPAALRPWRWLSTLLIVVLGWVMFRADGVTQALRFYRAMLTPQGYALSPGYAGSIDSLQLAVLGIAVLVLVWGGLRARLRPAWIAGGDTATALPAAWIAGLLLPVFALAVLKLSAQSYSPFLYFQF